MESFIKSDWSVILHLFSQTEVLKSRKNCDAGKPMPSTSEDFIWCFYHC